MDGSTLLRDHTRSPLHFLAGEVSAAASMAKQMKGAARAYNPINLLKPTFPKIEIPTGTERLVVGIPGVFGSGATIETMLQGISSDTVHGITWGNDIVNIPFITTYEGGIDFLRYVTDEFGGPVDGFGHSLGGIVWHHLNRMLPGHVDRIGCAASPIQLDIDGVYDATILGPAFSLMQMRLLRRLFHQDLMNSWSPEHSKDPVANEVFLTAALREAVVDPFSCLHFDNPAKVNAVIDTTHVGMVTDPLAIAAFRHFFHNGHETPMPGMIQAQFKALEELAKYHDRSDAIFARRALANGIGRFIDRTTRGIFDPLHATANARHEANGTLEADVVTSLADFDARRRKATHGTTGRTELALAANGASLALTPTAHEALPETTPTSTGPALTVVRDL